ncbi:GyrI-like domain-containing protein [Shewanella sp. 10N.7]|uniref:GyrI-like domain-containing protein n=1 Tax=Shewanella sp. 10N.7 TaxID=2885093 RepID=UPI001E2E3BFF|nr:GyrI-like domain-containing protein [Shewanella sp. 10N.7]
MKSMILEGRYATFLHSGSDEDLNKKVKYLYGTWLNEQSQNKAIQLKNLPLIFEKLNITQPQQIKTRVYLGFV